MISWLTGTTVGKFISTFFISMVPVVELRLGLPYGIALGLDYPLALIAAVLGNMLPVPFIIVYIRRIFAWLRRHWARLDSFITRLENKAHLKGEKVKKYGPIGLLIFVAIPLPGTGAWTGALVAALLDMRLKSAVPSILLGVIIAAGIMTALTFGVIRIV
ncbi:MAG: small multi-drug export protein [Oscillospiraceae bacterium]|nr:small multi-drug export protein [Oscillospiraceae bacterium]